MVFKYTTRSKEDWDKKANQSSNDFESFIKEQYRFFKAKKGNNCIRILPPTFENPEHYGVTVYVHYGVGPKRATVLCPLSMRKERCPLCEERARLQKIRASDEEIREFKATKRTLVWLLDSNDTDAGPLLWAMPLSVDNDICGRSINKKTGEVFNVDDPENGYDIDFKVSGEGQLTKYTSIEIDRHPSSVKEKWVDFVVEHPLTETLIWRDYDELKELYEGGASDDDAPANDPPRRRRDEEEAPVATTTRRRPNGHAEPAEEPVSKRRGREAEEEAPWEPEQTQRRPAPSQAPERSRDRRDEINDEVPMNGGRAYTKDDPEEDEPAPVSAADRLRNRYARK